MNQRTLIIAVLMVVTLPMAILLGQWAATDPQMAIGAGFLVVVLFIVAGMGRNIWLLIPMTVAFSGPVTALPGGFALRDLVIGLVVVTMIIHWIVRRYRVKMRFGLLEFALLLQFVMIAQTFMRNPVGLAVLGSSEVGGRAYFEMTIAIAAYLVLAMQVVPCSLVNRAALLMFIGALFLGLLGGLTLLVPAFGYAMTAVYAMAGASGAVARYHGVEVSQATEGRLPMLRDIARPLATGLFAKYVPFKLINPINIFVFLSVLIVAVCTLYSGYRGMVVWLGLMAVASAMIHKKVASFLLICLFALPILGGMVVLQGNLIQLPASAQRALSFLPGDWDGRVVQDAEGSIDWRIEMWEEVLTTERYITNKIIGDGFGFSQRELMFQINLGERSRNPEELQEYFLITGGYHSGPVESIRRVGYIGLAVLLIGMAIFWKEALNIVKLTRDTKFQAAAFYVTLPILVFPFYFVFVFGSYQAAIITMCVSGGLLRLIRNSVELDNSVISEKSTQQIEQN
jgi:hypothetical protein